MENVRLGSDVLFGSTRLAGATIGLVCNHASVDVGFVHVVDADLKAYFDSIPHDRLMALVKGSISVSRWIVTPRRS